VLNKLGVGPSDADIHKINMADLDNLSKLHRQINEIIGNEKVLED
jgi:hypothetical protein